MDKKYNIIGMWAFIWDEDTLVRRLFIYGKADENYYIVQAINALTGEPNVCKIFHIDEMKEWVFYPNRELVDEVFNEYCDRKINRYKLPR